MEKLFSPAILFGFGVTGIICTLLPIALLVIWRRKTRAAFLPPAVGLIMYLAVSLVRALIRSGFSSDDPSSFLFRQALLSGVLEEAARYIAFRFILQNYESREDAVSHGIGHGFFEVFSAGTLYIGYLSTGLEYNARGLERLAENFSPEDTERMFEYVKYVSGINPLFQLIGSVSAIVFHIAMSVIVFYGVRNERSRIILPEAIAVHTLINYVCALAPFGLEVTLTAISSAAAAYIAYRLYRGLPQAY